MIRTHMLRPHASMGLILLNSNVFVIRPFQPIGLYVLCMSLFYGVSSETNYFRQSSRQLHELVGQAYLFSCRISSNWFSRGFCRIVFCEAVFEVCMIKKCLLILLLRLMHLLYPTAAETKFLLHDQSVCILCNSHVDASTGC